SPPLHGTATLAGATLTYTPAADWSGSDSLSVAGSDGIATGAAATITVTVTPVNDAPTASPASLSTLEDTSTIATLAVGDVDGDALTAAIVSPPTHGSATLSGLTLTYSPAAD